MTPYRLLLSLSGLSQAEAADFHGVRLDTVKSWSAGRNRAPEGAISEVRDLIAKQARAADAALAKYREMVAEHGAPEAIDLTADALGGWPDGAERMALARVVAGLPAGQAVEV